MWNDLLMLTNDVRHICYGQAHKRPSPAAYDCLERFKSVLREEFKCEPTDDEVRDSVDLMFKDLISF